jgi:phosphatidylglycerophosphate synthase
LISAFICLYKIGVSFEAVRFPIWLVVAVISRDVILLLGSMIIHLIKGDITVATTVWGKGTAFFQMLAVMGILMQWRFSILLWYVIMVLVIISGMDYIIKGVKLLYSVDNQR